MNRQESAILQCLSRYPLKERAKSVSDNRYIDRYQIFDRKNADRIVKNTGGL